VFRETCSRNTTDWVWPYLAALVVSLTLDPSKCDNGLQGNNCLLWMLII